MRLLTLLLIAAITIVPWHAVYPDEISDPRTIASLNNMLFTSIQDNIYYELYINNYEDSVFINAENIGQIHINDIDMTQVSYGSHEDTVDISVWHSVTNRFQTRHFFKSSIEAWIEDGLRPIYESSDVSVLYTFEEWLNLWVICEVWINFVNFLQAAYITGDFDNIRFDSAINNMEIYWGIHLHPRIHGDIHIEFQFNGTATLALYHDDNLIHTWSQFFHHRNCMTDDTQEGIINISK